MDFVEVVKLVLIVSIVVTVFGFGLAATVQDVLYILRRPRILVISLTSMFIVMPFITLTLQLVLQPPQVAKVALVALALSPVPPILLAKQRQAGGHAAYGLGLTAVVSLLSIAIVPALVALLGGLMDEPFRTDPLAIAGQVLLMVELPLVVGMLVRGFLPRLAQRAAKPVARVAAAALAATALILLVTLFPRLWQVRTLSTSAAIVLFVVLGLAFGHILAGPAPGDSADLALSSAFRHPGIALGISTANFPSLDFGVVIVLYLLLSSIVCIPYVKWMQKQASR
jgi:bile acid:Na+ symporter, BASS family